MATASPAPICASSPTRIAAGRSTRSRPRDAGAPASMRMTTGPPFRAEHVGSLLRPAELHRARVQARAGALSAGELRAVEDRLIARAVAKQEAIGLHVG